MALIRLLLATRLGRFMAWAVAGFVALVAAWGAGRREGRQRAKSEALQRDVDTIERVQDATGDIRTVDDARRVRRNRPR